MPVQKGGIVRKEDSIKGRGGGDSAGGHYRRKG